MVRSNSVHGRGVYTNSIARQPYTPGVSPLFSWVYPHTVMQPSPAPPPDSRADLAETARLLRSVFPVPRFEGPRYLEWFYRQNPVGPAIEIDRTDGPSRIGHVAGIPQEYHSAAGSRMSVFPL